MSIDYAKPENWTVDELIYTLEHYTVLKDEEKNDFDLLWKAKLDCEKNVGVIIKPKKRRKVGE